MITFFDTSPFFRCLRDSSLTSSSWPDPPLDKLRVEVGQVNELAILHAYTLLRQFDDSSLMLGGEIETGTDVYGGGRQVLVAE